MLLLHSDEELVKTLGSRVVERETIHQWPLSIVQRLLLENGAKLIYKSQLPPTVEPQFYENASSSLLARHRLLGKLGDCEVMAIDWIDAPLLRELFRDENDLADHGRRLVTQIGEIRGEPPTYLKLGSPGMWSVFANDTVDKLRGLIRRGRFKSVTLGAVDELSRWAGSAEVLAAIADNPRLIHGDLRASQVFVCADGYRVIDWQRPMIAPPETDLVSLLIGERIDPRRFVNDAVVGIFWFLFLFWAVHAQLHLFPDFPGPLFDHWTTAAVRQILDPNAWPPPPGIPPA